MAKAEKDDRRAHLRYRDPESKVVSFYRYTEDGKRDRYLGLIINESYGGMALVFVGSVSLVKGDTVYWEEADQIHTPCKVAYCRKLDADVYSLGLSLEV